MKILRKIWKWINANRLRRILSSVLITLVFLTSIRYLFLNPKEAKAAISEVNASSSTTLDQLAYTQVNSMTLTPGAGDYLAIFTMEVQYSASPASNTIYTSIFVNGVQQTHTERQLDSDGSLTSSIQVVTTHSYVTLAAGQSVDVRYKISATPAMTGLKRSLTLLPVNSANVTQVTATADDAPATNPTSYTQLNSMTTTPGAGDYLLIFSTSAAGTNAAGGEELNFAVFVNGTIVQHTERTMLQEASIPTADYPVLIAAKISPGAGEAVTIQWKNSGAGTNVIAHQRTLTLIKMGANELYEANATADATDAGTSDIRIDSMALSPKPADYLAIFNSSDLYGTVTLGSDQQAYYSFYVNGYQTASTQRDFYREESIDNANMYNFTVGKITVHAGEKAEVMWRGTQTGTRTIHERTFVLVREPPTSSSSGQVYLTMNEGSDRFVNDENVNVPPGEIRGATWKTSEFCKVGKCAYFDGTADYIILNDDADLDMGSGEGVTVEGWFRTPDITSGSRAIISKYETAGSDGGYAVAMNSSGTIIFGIDNNNTSYPADSVTTTTAYDDNQWHHFAAVKNGNTSISLYMDGNLIGSDSSLTATDASNNDYFYIGHDDVTSSDFRGFIDEVKVYRTARSSSEIETDYAGTTANRSVSANFGPDNSFLSNGLVGYWPMDETGNTCSGGTNDNCDLSGNGKDGAWNGNTTSTSGIFGNGTIYDGTGDYTAISESDSDGNLDFSTGDNFTLSFWLNPTSLPSGSTYDTYVGKNNGGDGWYAQIEGTGNMEFCITNTSSQCYTSTTTPITAGVWQHYVITTTFGSDETTKMYYNGSQIPGSWSSGTNLAPPLSNDALRIGGNGDGTEEATGKVDDVRIYNRVLSPSMVQQLNSWAPGPVGYWKFDENAGTNTNDSSGNSYAGSFNGGTLWNTGKFGTGIKTVTTGDYIQVTDNSNLRISNKNITVEAWVKRNGRFGSWNTIVDKSASSASEYWFGFGTSDFPGFMLNPGTSSDTDRYYVYANTAITDNNWHHIAGTYDGSYVRVYVDGVLDMTPSAHSEDIYSGTGNIKMGDSTDFSGNPFDGITDEVRIYNYARSAKEIIEDMNGGHSAPGSPVGSATAQWNMDEGYGTTAHDSSVNALDLTLSTASWTNSGKTGKAWNGDGTKWLSIADASTSDKLDFAASDDFTISLWMRSDSATNPSATEYLLSKAEASAGYRIFSLNDSSGKVRFGIDDDTTWTPDDYAQSSTDVYDTNWHNIVAVKQGTSKIQLYVDGKLENEDTSLAATGTLANSITFYLGDRNGVDGGDEFNGDLDNVRIYRSALTTDQIYELYNQGANAVMGAKSTDSSGNASWSANEEYCPPGQGSSCTAPILHVPFDENTGTTSVHDISTNGFTGTMNGSIPETAWQPGKLGSSLNFDGSDDNVSITDNATLDITGDFTLSAWYNRTAANNDVVVAKTNGGGSGGYALLVGGSGEVYCRTDNGTTHTDSYTATGLVTANGQWHHILAVRSGSSCRVWVDGVDKTSTAATHTTLIANALNLIIGGQPNGSDSAAGRIDDVRLYNYARSAAQITWEYNHGDPVGWWKMDEASWNGTASEVKDSSGNAFHGVRSGNATTATGKYNNAGTFDGTGDYVTTSNPTALQLSTTGTVAAWIKWNSSSNPSPPMVCKGDWTNDRNGYCLAGYGGGIDGELANATAQLRIHSTNTNYRDNSWHHAVLTWNGTWVNLYVDGSPAASPVSQDLNPLSTSYNLYIGSDTTNYDYFYGLIDDVRIYNYALSPQQVKLIYNGGAALRFAPLTGTP